MNDAPLSDLLIQYIINTKNKLMVFSGSGCQDCPYTGRSKRPYIIFYQCGTIDHCTHFPGPFSQSSAKNEYNGSCTTVMALAHFRILINDFLKKDPNIFSKKDPIFILDSKYYLCMSNNGKATKHTRHIARKVHFKETVKIAKCTRLTGVKAVCNWQTL